MRNLLTHSFPRKNTKIYLLNVGPEELAEFKKIRKNTERLTGYPGLSKAAKNSGIIVEDIINMSKKDEQQLRRNLNYDAHHKSQKLFCVSHSIYKTSVWSLLSFFHSIIFTSAPSNVPVLRITLNYFKIDKEQVSLWIEKFKKISAGGRNKNLYFFFDCSQLTFWASTDLTDPRQLKLVGSLNLDSVSDLREADSDSEPGLRKELQEKFDKFLDGHPFRSQASAAFSIIVNCLELSLIREHDLTVCFKSRTGGRLTRLSLVDYIAALLDAEAEVTKSHVVLHKYLKQFCFLPKVFVKNEKFATIE